MNGVRMGVLLFALCVTGVARGETIRVLCDNCDETAYLQAAMSYGDRYGEPGDVVLVTDVGNGLQRKFSMTTSGYRKASLLQEDRQLLEWALDAVIALGTLGTRGFCGPGFLGDLMVWDGPDGAYGPACRAHDECYARGGDEEDRARCDYDLYWSLRMDAGARFGSVAYFTAVRRAGARHFNYTSGNGWYSGGGGYYGGSTGGLWGQSYIDPRTGIIPLAPPPSSSAGWNADF